MTDALGDRPVYRNPADKDPEDEANAIGLKRDGAMQGVLALARELLNQGNWLLSVIALMFTIILLPVLIAALASGHLEVFWVFGLSAIVIITYAIADIQRSKKSSAEHVAQSSTKKKEPGPPWRRRIYSTRPRRRPR